MPDARLARARATLPHGYQFGDHSDASMDAGERVCFEFFRDRLMPHIERGIATSQMYDANWRSPSENAAEQLERRARQLRRRAT